MLQKKSEKPNGYKYSFGRKAFFTIIGLLALILGFYMKTRMHPGVNDFRWFSMGVVGIITQFGLINGGISVASFLNHKNKS